eukprot:scaffold330_cov246-Pinguiococcus_pyrenoidosus.AAC.12
MPSFTMVTSSTKMRGITVENGVSGLSNSVAAELLEQRARHVGHDVVLVRVHRVVPEVQLVPLRLRRLKQHGAVRLRRAPEATQRQTAGQTPVLRAAGCLTPTRGREGRETPRGEVGAKRRCATGAIQTRRLARADTYALAKRIQQHAARRGGRHGATALKTSDKRRSESGKEARAGTRGEGRSTC